MKVVHWSAVIVLCIGVTGILAPDALMWCADHMAVIGSSRPVGGDQLPDEAALDVANHAILDRVAARQAIVTELLNERMTLLEAAARFRALTPATPQQRAWLRAAYPGRTDAECYCRQVIAYARVRLRDQPEAAQRILARLDAELQAHLSPNATLLLPAIGDAPWGSAPDAQPADSAE